MEDKAGRVMEKIEENEEILERVIERIVMFEKTGVLKSLQDLASLIKAFEDMLSDEIVRKNAEMITNLGLVSAKFVNEDVLMLLNSVSDAIRRFREDKEQVGIIGLIKALSDPDVKLALGFLVNIAKSLGKALRERA